MKLQITAKKCWAHLWQLVLLFLFCISLPFYFKYILGEQINTFVIYITLLIFLLICTPAIYLFVRYYKHSKKTGISYHDDYFEIHSKETCKKLKWKQVDKVVFNVTLPVHFNSIRMLATDSFLFATIYIQSGEEIKITSLVDIELIETRRNFIGKVRIETRSKFICWL